MMLIPLARSRPPKLAKILFKSKTLFMWPAQLYSPCTHSPARLAALGEELILSSYSEQLLLLSVMLTMGAAAPLVAVTTAIAALALALHHTRLFCTLRRLMARETKRPVADRMRDEKKRPAAAAVPARGRAGAEALMQVDGSLPLGAAMIPCVGALAFWVVFGWGGLNFGWIIGLYTLLFAVAVAAVAAWWARRDHRATRVGSRENERWGRANHDRNCDKKRAQPISMGYLIS
eukprot:jgi/Bigna1/142027/aug1.66_g16735